MAKRTIPLYSVIIISQRGAFVNTFFKKKGEKIMNYLVCLLRLGSKYSETELRNAAFAALEDNVIVLFDEDIHDISLIREKAVSENGLVEVGAGAVAKIMKALLSSGYVDKYNYVQTVCEMADVFYFIKGETDEELNDNEIIGELVREFNGEAGGAIELIQGLVAERILRRLKGLDDDDEYESDDDDGDN